MSFRVYPDGSIEVEDIEQAVDLRERILARQAIKASPPPAPDDSPLPFDDEDRALAGMPPAPTCAEIVSGGQWSQTRPCGRPATRYNAESKVPFCDEHGGQNPRY